MFKDELSTWTRYTNACVTQRCVVPEFLKRIGRSAIISPGYVFHGCVAPWQVEEYRVPEYLQYNSQ